MNFVILNVDLVASTKLSMTLPLDRLTIMIQAFNQEMALIVIIQSGWDIHPNITSAEKIGNNNNISKKEQPLIKKPVYDVLGYSTSIAVKMTSLANPNHMVIGQLVYDVLDDNQKLLFQQLTLSPEIWSYVNINTGGGVYNIYINK